MLSGKPDPSLNLDRLEREIRAYHREIKTADQWYYRESYIDRGILDPYYMIEFHSEVDDLGDDLYNIPLYQTKRQGFSGICVTRQQPAKEQTYWKQTKNDALIHRLERFMKMFREDYLQPSGAKGDLYSPQNQHDIFEEKRFLYEIRSPRRGIIGVGPKMYAGLGIGAICGQVTDENNQPLADAIVELIEGEKTSARRTDKQGMFWFAKVLPGKHRICVRSRNCKVRIIDEEYFGNVKGWLADQDGNPIEDADIYLIAPDAEEFPAITDASGKFTTGPLPAFPYIMRIPAHLFAVEKSIYVNDAMLGGVLKAQDGSILAKQTVILKQQQSTVKETLTDEEGRFLFDGLTAGRYLIEVAGQTIFTRRAPAGIVEGRAEKFKQPAELWLIAEERTIAKERLSREGGFYLSDVPPSRYRLSVT